MRSLLLAVAIAACGPPAQPAAAPDAGEVGVAALELDAGVPGERLQELARTCRLAIDDAGDVAEVQLPAGELLSIIVDLQAARAAAP